MNALTRLPLDPRPAKVLPSLGSRMTKQEPPASGPLDLEVEFRELIRALEAATIDYAVVGGFAVAIWGAPRATTEIDR